MGGDGGVIANKRKFIPACKSDDAEAIEAQNIKRQQVIKSRVCAVSGQVLSEPIVCCRLGYLFNKESIVTALLEKNLNSNFSHIRSLKDIKQLILTKNPEYTPLHETNGEFIVQYVCPITMIEFDGIHEFVAIWPTGYVVSERGLKEVGLSNLQAEYGPFTMEDTVRLLPTEDDLRLRTATLQATRELSLRKSKEQKKRLKQASSSSAVVDGGADDGLDMKEAPGNVADHHAHVKHVFASSSTTIPPLPLAPPSSSSLKSISAESRVLITAQSNVANQESKSEVFKNIFHNGKDVSKKDRDLFMSVAGFRYTLG